MVGNRSMTWPITFVITACLVLLPGVHAADETENRWETLREVLFPKRIIRDGAHVLTLDAPYRAHDAAIVPIKVELAFPQTEKRHITTITLLIDENPVPLAGRFHFTLASGLAAFSTRVRVNAYTHIRAIAQTHDGELYMVKRFVKASGGCSAPASKDPDAALARLGEMKLRHFGERLQGEPSRVQLLVSHPNSTGMQMDQLTRHYLPAHFIKRIQIFYQDRPVLRVDSSISLSEDPSLHFHYVPNQAGELLVKVADNKERIFTRSWLLSDVRSEEAESSS